MADLGGRTLGNRTQDISARPLSAFLQITQLMPALFP